jgi:hypothetical protein
MRSAEPTQLQSILCITRSHLKYSVIKLKSSNLNIVPGRESEWDDIYFIAWMDMIMGGIRGLQYFTPENGGVWG